MKQLTVISGKGGTGKTTITAAFATLSNSHVIADCDVDAADLHLILHPTVEKSEEFYGGRIAVLDKDKCIGCTCNRACSQPVYGEQGLIKAVYFLNCLSQILFMLGHWNNPAG